MKNIIISGYYGYGNTGDEAILSSMIKKIKDQIYDCNIIVISGNIDETKRLHEVDAVNRYDFITINHSIEKCDLVILGGGGLFQDNHKIDVSNIFTQPGYGTASYVIVPLIAKMHNKPVIYYSQGIGPLFSKESKTFVSFASEVADIITVRDNESRDLLIEIGVQPSKIILSADPAINLDIISPENIKIIFDIEKIPSANIICVCLRGWIDKSLEEKYKTAVSEGLDNFLNDNNFNLVFVPFQQTYDNNDVDISKEIIEKMKNRNKCYILKGSYSPQQIAGIISKSNLVIGMRYHSIIFSVISKIPFVAVSYDPKVKNLVQELGLEEYCIDIDSINSKDVGNAIIKALENKEKIQEILESSIIVIRNRLEFGSGIIKKILEDSNDDFIVDIPIIEKMRLLNTTHKQIQILNQIMSYIYCQLKDKDNLISDVRSQLKDKDNIISDVRLQLKDKDNIISDVRSQLKNKDNIISDVKSDIETKNTAIAELQYTILQRESSISWRFSQFYGRYFDKDSFLTRFISYVTRKNKVKTGTNLKYDIFKKICMAILPKNLYLELGKDYILADNSKVVLYYNDPAIMPGYPYRRLIDRNCGSPIKVSLIATVKNEEKTARKWLDSVKLQTRVPDELVIVDGGSKDRTVDIIREFATSSSIMVNLINAPGLNIAEGRNLAIKNAKYDIIACTDFGNVLDRQWLELITVPFCMDNNVDVSAGFYKPLVEKQRDVLVSKFFIPDINNINPQHFLPASKSVAFKKTKWAMVDGYPTWLTYAAEDTLFDCELKRIGGQWAFVPEAIAYWKIHNSFPKIFKTVYRYAKGDGEAGLFGTNYRSNMKTLLGKSWMLFGIGLLCGLGTYLFGITLILESIGISILSGVVLLVFFDFFDINIRIKSKIISTIITIAQITGFIVGVANRPNVKKRKSDKYIHKLNEIIEKYSCANGVVVYPPTHDWGFMFQRPHQMARAFSKKNYLYFFCTNNELTDVIYGFKEVEPFLYVCNVPIETFSMLKSPMVYIGSAWNRKTISIFNQPEVIYDHYDELEISTAHVEDHIKLLKLAKVVLVTADKLVNNVTKYRKDILLIPNGVDYEMIHKNKPLKEDEIPDDIKPIILKNKIIIGYSGALAKWFDYDLLEYLAKKRTDIEFVLLGVNYDGSVDKSNILKFENVHWLGMKSYEELFKYVWRFDIAIIPFRINNITIATSPIKLFEYMACLKPVITTALPECRKYDGVFVANTYEQFNDYINKALSVKKDHDYLSKIDKVARDNTWDNRVDKVIAELQRKRNDD